MRLRRIGEAYAFACFLVRAARTAVMSQFPQSGISFLRKPQDAHFDAGMMVWGLP